MSLLKDWHTLLNGQDEVTVKGFWEEYSFAEIKIYKDLLSNKQDNLEGKLSDVADNYGVRPIMLMGFLDGINTSLKTPIDLDNMYEESDFKIEIDFKTLYLNMLKVPAEHLYALEEWDNVLSETEKNEIAKSYKKSKIVVNENKVGRNEPCPCGSGKKYKKCCGR